MIYFWLYSSLQRIYRWREFEERNNRVAYFNLSCQYKASKSRCTSNGTRAILNPVARWHCKNLSYPKQVDVSYQRFHGLRMPVRQIKWLLLQPCREATVTIMEHSTILETTVTGGVLRRTMQQMHGTVT